MQPLNSRSAGGSLADDFRESSTPREMTRPHVLARVVQRDFFFGNGIGRGDSYVFATVASLAGKRQVRLVIRTTVRLRNDMLDAQRVRAVLPLRETVLAAIRSAFPDRLASGAAD